MTSTNKVSQVHGRSSVRKAFLISDHIISRVLVHSLALSLLMTSRSRFIDHPHQLSPMMPIIRRYINPLPINQPGVLRKGRR
jgi:hypothetical protein